MGRGLILGMGWGVMVAGLAGTTLSLIYSNDNVVPSEVAAIEDTPAPETAPEIETDPATAGPATTEPMATELEVSEPVMTQTRAEVSTAPEVGTVQAPSQTGDAQDMDPEKITVPIADQQDVTTQPPAAPEMTQGDVQPEMVDAMPVDAPEVMIPNVPNEDQTPSQNETGGEAMASLATDDPVTPNANTPVQAAPEVEQPDMQTDSGAVQPAPKQQVAIESSETMQEAAVDPDEPDANPSTEAQEVAPEESAPEKPSPKPAGQFDTTRVPVPKMANLAPNVRTNRLPTIGGPTETAETADAAPAEPEDARALAAYAMKFENPDAKPMFSVILIDDAQNPVSIDVLSHLPFALSFAIDAARDDATDVAERYRAAGFEVLMLTNLPFGASATDIEVVFGAYARALPEAIGVLDLGGNGFLRGPSTATQIAGIMSEHGYGLVTPSKGLNSAQKAAMREGVPAVLIYRELDADGEKPTVIRRYLDRAAFRAAQEGSVIMLGHTRPDTIEALVTWALEDRAASLAIAPASAVMLAQ